MVSRRAWFLAYGVGAALRQERVRQNVTLEQIASQTRISARFLNAIEEEDFEKLPGILFTRNFVRQYALALELDPDPLLAQLPKVDLTDVPAPAASGRSRNLQWDPRWNSAISLTAWVLLAVSAAVAAFLYFNRPASPRTEIPKSLAPAVTAVPASLVVASTPVSAPLPATPHHAVEVLVTAREQSWVQVTADGKVAFTATLQPNESRSVAADDQVKVVTGNAGGVAISLNGKPLEALGPVGQVRTVRLTAAGPQLVPKTPPPQQPTPPAPL